jgi:mRNA-degrading endonuclease RelE of RelBE toxin-antitoxin system
MTVHYLSSYDRSFKKLPGTLRQNVIDAIDSLLTFFQTGQRPLGLGLRQLRRPYWEVRVGLSTRILFAFEKEAVTFVLVGDHDDIRRSLRRM